MPSPLAGTAKPLKEGARSGPWAARAAGGTSSVRLGVTMHFAVYRFTGPLLALALSLADTPALAQPGTAQLATGRSRRAPRPPVDPATRELRQARGILVGGIVLTTLCGVGFGLATYSAVDRWERLTGASGERSVAAVGVLFACTLVSIAGIGIGASRLRTIKRSGRVAWTGGLGLRF